MTGRGLALAPALSLSKGRWSARHTQVVVERPDGGRNLAKAMIEPMHFRYPEPIAAAKVGKSTWMLVASLTDAQKDVVPVASRILAPREIARS